MSPLPPMTPIRLWRRIAMQYFGSSRGSQRSRRCRLRSSRRGPLSRASKWALCVNSRRRSQWSTPRSKWGDRVGGGGWWWLFIGVVLQLFEPLSSIIDGGYGVTLQAQVITLMPNPRRRISGMRGGCKEVYTKTQQAVWTELKIKWSGSLIVYCTLIPYL